MKRFARPVAPEYPDYEQKKLFYEFPPSPRGGVDIFVNGQQLVPGTQILVGVLAPLDSLDKTKQEKRLRLRPAQILSVQAHMKGDQINPLITAEDSNTGEIYTIHYLERIFGVVMERDSSITLSFLRIPRPGGC